MPTFYLFSIVSMGRVAVRGSGALASIAAAVVASQVANLDMDLILLCAELCLDEDCALMLGHYGAHKKLLSLLADESLDVDNVGLYDACELAVERCSAACSGVGFSFPLTRGDQAESLVAKRPPFLCMTSPSFRPGQ
jgi:hypothetical protein